MSKVIDLEPYGYPTGTTLSLKDPTPRDMIAVAEYAKKDKDELTQGLFLISRLILHAPFDSSIESLKDLPMSLITHITMESEEMVLPLEEKMREKSQKLIAEEYQRMRKSKN
jgi:hypothetical protein